MYRIIGILAIIGFVVIMLPFFTGSKEAPNAPTAVNAPPFPNQAEVSNLTTAHAKETPQLDPAFAATNHTATEEANSAKSTLDNTLVNDNAEKPAAEQKSLIPQSTITSSDPITPPAERDLKKTQKHLFAKHQEAPQKPLIASLRNSATHHGLLKLNSPIWVI